MRDADDAERVAPRGTGAGNTMMELIYFEAPSVSSVSDPLVVWSRSSTRERLIQFVVPPQTSSESSTNLLRPKPPERPSPTTSRHFSASASRLAYTKHPAAHTTTMATNAAAEEDEDDDDGEDDGDDDGGDDGDPSHLPANLGKAVQSSAHSSSSFGSPATQRRRLMWSHATPSG